MKKLATLINSALLSLTLATPALAQGTGTVGFEKPAEAKITDIGKLISTGISVVIIVSGILVFVFLVWGGVEWLTSGGDKTKIENARSKLTNALIGVAIIAAAYAVWTLALTFFGVDVSNVCSDNPIPG